jgi:hypothetical protein
MFGGAAFAFGSAGQPCGIVNNTTYTACAAGGLCKGASGLTAGTCQATAADGAACDDTAGPPCLSPAVCSGGVCKISDPGTCN